MKNADKKQLIIYASVILAVLLLFSLVLFLPKCAKNDPEKDDKVTESAKKDTEDTTEKAEDTTSKKDTEDKEDPKEETTDSEDGETTERTEIKKPEPLPDDYEPEKDENNYVKPPQTQSTSKPYDPLKGVPEKYKNSYFFTFRGKGSSMYLKGKVAFIFIFIEDPKYKWEDSEIEKSKTKIDDRCNNLLDNAKKYGASLEITKTYLETAVSVDVGVENRSVWSREAANQLGYSALAQLMSEVQIKQSADSTAVVFCYNRTGRAAASVSDSAWYQEYALIYKDLTPIDHESLHLFGAKDYYFPDAVKDAAKECFGSSIMLEGGRNVDPLNAFLVGWTETLSEEALKFLEMTSSYTEEEMEEAHKEDAFTGYVENKVFDLSYLKGTYTGDLVRGLPEGKGKLETKDSVYNGEWVGGRKNGYGEEIGGSISYKGYWKDGAYHGEGTQVDHDGSVYVGSFAGNQENGKGKKTYPNGDVIEGQWKNGIPSGICKYTYADGGVYEGELYSRDRVGQGTMKYANGEVYSGGWQYNKRMGKGTMSFANGDVYSGYWTYDRISGSGEMKYANGDVYIGEFYNSKQHKKGVLLYANGDKYEGEWYYGELHMEGTYTYADGRVEKHIYSYGRLDEKYEVNE